MAAVLFGVGVAIERNGHHESTHTGVTVDATHSESTAETSEEGHTGETARSGGAHDEKAEAKVLGVDIESNGVVALASALAVGRALLLWFRSERVWWLLAGVFAVGSLIFDIAEVLHQLDDSRPGLAAIAAAVALAHLIVVTCAALVVSRQRALGRLASAP